MFENLSEKIRECYRHASDCERRAEGQADSALRKNFLDSAEHWIRLAHSYEFADRLLKFLPKQLPD